MKNLSFNRHIDLIVAYSMLGFIKRICKDVRKDAALKSIYFAHARSYIQYASVVWSPVSHLIVVDVNCLESTRYRINSSAMFVFDVLTFVNYGLCEPIAFMSRAFNMFSHLYQASLSRYEYRSAVKLKCLTDSDLSRHGFLLLVV